MPTSPSAARPVTADDPAWFDCGPIRSPDYGSLFVQPAALGATAYWFDRGQHRFAMSCRAGPRLGEIAQLHGRAFPVADWTDAAKTDPAALARWSALNGGPAR
jgi:hypothetical protein